MFSIKTHSVIDYVAGVALLLAPFIAGFGGIDAARNIFILGGITLIGYSLCTKYELAIWRKIPIGVHMALDVAMGIVLLAAPFVFGYRALLSGGQEFVHYVLGLGVVGLVAFTRQKSTSGSVEKDFRDVAGGDDYRRAG